MPKGGKAADSKRIMRDVVKYPRKKLVGWKPAEMNEEQNGNGARGEGGKARLYTSSANVFLRHATKFWTSHGCLQAGGMTTGMVVTSRSWCSRRQDYELLAPRWHCPAITAFEVSLVPVLTSCFYGAMRKLSSLVDTGSSTLTIGTATQHPGKMWETPSLG